MKNSMPPTMEELKLRRRRALEKAEQVIAGRLSEYRELKRLVDEALDRPVDVADYYRVAGQIAGLLEKLSASSPGSLFAYFSSNIDPERQGDARYFKVVCEDLRQQIKLIDQYRRQRHRLRPVG